MTNWLVPWVSWSMASRDDSAEVQTGEMFAEPVFLRSEILGLLERKFSLFLGNLGMDGW